MRPGDPAELALSTLTTVKRRSKPQRSKPLLRRPRRRRRLRLSSPLPQLPPRSLCPRRSKRSANWRSLRLSWAEAPLLPNRSLLRLRSQRRLLKPKVNQRKRRRTRTRRRVRLLRRSLKPPLLRRRKRSNLPFR